MKKIALFLAVFFLYTSTAFGQFARPSQSAFARPPYGRGRTNINVNVGIGVNAGYQHPQPRYIWKWVFVGYRQEICGYDYFNCPIYRTVPVYEWRQVQVW
jgi:hypothetical protein